MDSAALAKSLLGLVPSLQLRGSRLVDAGELLSLLQYQFGTHIVAATGTTVGAAAQLVGGVNAVDTASAGQSALKLPRALSGGMVTVINDTTTGLLVFPSPPDQVYPTASVTPSASSVTVATGTSVIFISHKNGFWKEFVSA